jgi:hypothetical protein
VAISNNIKMTTRHRGIDQAINECEVDGSQMMASLPVFKKGTIVLKTARAKRTVIF